MAKKLSLIQRLTAILIAGSGIAISIAYVTHHTDIIPDILGIYGYLDDAIFIFFVMEILIGHTKY